MALGPAIATLLRAASTVATAFVVLGFLLFAIDETGEASARQLQKLAGIAEPVPTEAAERQREQEQNAVDELIDDANDVLLRPFSDVTHSEDSWVRRGAPTLLAILAYGVLLRIVAGYALGLRWPRRGSGPDFS